MSSIKLNGRTIGNGRPCFLVAEIGINHNGDLDLAKRTIDAAVASGADSVKFQNYHTEDFLSDRTLTHEYISQDQHISEPQFDIFKRCELDRNDLHKLKEHCDRQGILFHSTPTSAKGIADLVEIGCPLLKNGSDYLVHLPLIRAMGQSGLPTVLSTGMATLSEIDEAVRVYRETGNEGLILLHCTSTYPSPLEDVHLRKIEALRAAFGCAVGFSDHTDGIVAAVGAVALGACWMEKHFTLDKDQAGPDHRFSADPAEFAALVSAVRGLEAALGASSIGPTPSEEKGRRDYRLSCVALRRLSTGQRVQETDLAFRRPGHGLPPGLAHLLIGRTLRRDIPAGEFLDLDACA